MREKIKIELSAQIGIFANDQFVPNVKVESKFAKFLAIKIQHSRLPGCVLVVHQRDQVVDA